MHTTLTQLYLHSEFSKILMSFLTDFKGDNDLLSPIESFIVAKSALLLGDFQTTKTLLPKLEKIPKVIIEARVLIEEQKYHSALNILKTEAESQGKQLDELNQEEGFLWGELWGTLAFIYGYLGEFDQACTAIMEASSLFKTSQHPHLYYHCLINLSVYYEKLGDRVKKRFLLNQVRNETSKDQYGYIQAVIHRLLGMDAFVRGEFESAQDHWLECQSFFLINDRFNDQIRILSYLVELYTIQGDLAQAKNCFDEFKSLMSHHQGLTNLSSRFDRLNANLEFHQGNFTLALDKFKQLSEQNIPLMELEDIVKDYLEKLLICHQTKEARSLLQKHRSLFYDRSDEFFTIDIRPLESLLLFQEGMMKEAKSLILNCLDYAKTNQKMRDQTFCHYILGLLASKRKDYQAWEEHFSKSWNLSYIWGIILQLGFWLQS